MYLCNLTLTELTQINRSLQFSAIPLRIISIRLIYTYRLQVNAAVATSKSNISQAYVPGPFVDQNADIAGLDGDPKIFLGMMPVYISFEMSWERRPLAAIFGIANSVVCHPVVSSATAFEADTMNPLDRPEIDLEPLICVLMRSNPIIVGAEICCVLISFTACSEADAIT
jgi:hypothetical protein